ncbi:hypothetical protein Ctob_008006 [Chrysochromulina tobinii]|uniref:Uncharacterized protein n=1 Tax=Chrysochromulina tobinii TaxID=1460289 RepID=A0A0M0JFY9_9EUKA|nr:hypothetical protein Ctob_008006 [Chrysochromulina tobinii]|eukprot:KOO25479.1 hypothetical protein Ctob_008006 [Chrysochromulina sp. CCMP291]
MRFGPLRTASLRLNVSTSMLVRISCKVLLWPAEDACSCSSSTSMSAANASDFACRAVTFSLEVASSAAVPCCSRLAASRSASAVVSAEVSRPTSAQAALSSAVRWSSSEPCRACSCIRVILSASRVASFSVRCLYCSCVLTAASSLRRCPSCVTPSRLRSSSAMYCSVVRSTPSRTSSGCSSSRSRSCNQRSNSAWRSRCTRSFCLRAFAARPRPSSHSFHFVRTSAPKACTATPEAAQPDEMTSKSCKERGCGGWPNRAVACSQQASVEFETSSSCPSSRMLTSTSACLSERFAYRHV